MRRFGVREGSQFRQKRLVLLMLGVFFCHKALAPAATAATAAYWRHEENVPVGSIVPGGDDTVLDSSGNGNHMRTFASGVAPFTAATYSSIVSPLPLRSGLPNTKSLDFGPSPTIGTEDGGGLNDDNYTNNKPIQTQLFTAMTVELAFNMHSIGGFQAVFGKDGKPLGDAPGEPDSPVPPFKIMVRGDSYPDGVPNQIFVEWIDGNGTIRQLATRETTAANTWYHIAVTRTATDAQLWLAGETGDYTLKDSLTGQNFAGPSGEVEIFEPLGYSIGRGMFNNGVTDWASAIIDEVRISDVALTKDQFLFVPNIATNADFDGNGTVDGRDFLVWQRGQGGAGGHSAGDANGDNTVNAADLAIWKSQFGSSAVSAVPEPGATVLLMLGLSMAVAGACRRS
jgi:hypothetical protein